ncbi:MAG: polynucleotide adenylyltransferase PcnB [Acidobacteria bacterium]|nr:polynucleotide adenylyltransferase PcnB [Acidobacteriota bacterium]
MPQAVVPRVIPRPEHTISRRQISSGALKVLYRLSHAGYLAYLVGGGVRDLLLGKTPKDFDVVTNARPREIRRLFRNSRIIGRRFRLVHVMFQDGIVEVATFRASPEPPEAPDGWEENGDEDELAPAAFEDAGPAPNGEEPVFGTPAEDALRRDFTVNALFYNISDFSIIDYVGGIEDLHNGLLRVIGEPQTRFHEDPVRMLRALEYMVRLGFELTPGIEEAIEANRREILTAAPARLAYELVETLRSGVSVGICEAWRRFGFLDLIFPEAAHAGRALGSLLGVIDRWTNQDRKVPTSVLLGTAFLPAYAHILGQAVAAGGKINNPALLDAIAELVNPSVLRLHISHHDLFLIRQGLFTLSKLRKAPERGRQVQRLVRQEYFPVAWAFDCLAVEAGLLPAAPHAAWRRALERFEEGATDQDGGRPHTPRPSRRRRPGRRRRT